MTRASTAVRLFLTVWLVYAAFATTNVVRETYLAVSLGERLSVRVDPYLGLHPDLFEIPGRGSYINSNPGASLVGAIPYAVARPLIAGLFALRPELGAPKPPTAYNDPRPNRTNFMNEMRARGLDVRLALAALVTQVGLMAPLGALAAVVLFRYLGARYRDERLALWMALLYALGTPIFFRSAFLNQNALLAHLVLGAWVVLTWPTNGEPPRSRRGPWALAGLLLGAGLLMDYSAAPLALVFGGWALMEGWQRNGPRGAVELGGACVAGAIGPVLLLLGYQWLAFGSPWFPAQRYMPATDFSVRGWNGVTLPDPELLWRNLLDLRYGLFAFCPLLAVGLAAPFVRRVAADPDRREQAVALIAVGALLLFSAANQFSNLQWNTGVRYLVPAGPLLFLLVVPVLRALPRWAAIGLVVPTLIISVAVSMMREGVAPSLALLFTVGPTLPVLLTLQKTAAAYAPALAGGVQPFGVLAILGLAAGVVLIWRFRRPQAG
ncbi:MAG: hypothetical protein IPJ11_06100 [Gemmatimonadetes bacterium]|nr:hypothetical protein [Gemmatimonadota bacterium]